MGQPGHLPDGVVETHASRLVFLGDRAYKIKKPVRFAFLDFSTVEARGEACQREVQLNRRLSPDVYLAVLEVVGPDALTREHVIEMRRMPPDRRLATLVAEDAPDVADCVRAVARRIAGFHAGATRGAVIDEDSSHASIGAAWAENLDEMAQFCEGSDAVFAAGDLAEVERLAIRWLEGRAAVFDERLAGGHAVDGHGDLLAEDIFCLDDGPRILDCIEFDDHLRHVDVWNDVAFLAMDLERLGRADLALVLTDTYREMSADPAPRALVDLFVAHRALVRAKVAALRSTQSDDDVRDVSRSEARSLLAQCLDHLRRAQVRLVVVGGLPGVGKSTLAADLADSLDASVLSSDPLRAELTGSRSGRAPAPDFREGAYAADVSEAVYRSLLERARVVMARGGSVVLDASWLDAAHREAARRSARDCGAALVELRCVCPPEVAAARIEQRRRSGAAESDVDVDLARRMAVEADPWPEALVVDTSPGADALAAALALVR
jgi:aminoglycoside phosphotransferase family enzyme/predicted kinase